MGEGKVYPRPVYHQVNMATNDQLAIAYLTDSCSYGYYSKIVL